MGLGLGENCIKWLVIVVISIGLGGAEVGESF